MNEKEIENKCFNIPDLQNVMLHFVQINFSYCYEDKKIISLFGKRLEMQA